MLAAGRSRATATRSSTRTCPTSASAWAARTDNELTAQVLAVAGPAATADARPRSWPPAVPRGSGCRPSAAGPTRSGRARTCAAPLDLPVLIVAGSDLAAETAAARRRSGRCRHRGAGQAAPVPVRRCQHSRRPGGRGRRPPSRRTRVALLNRGTPSGLVTPDGTAHHGADARVQHLAVRSLDRRQEAHDPGRHQLRLAALEPHLRVRARRRARRPGGRPASRPRARTTTTTCSTIVTDLHAGPLPASRALASVEPAGALLSTLKPHGNPLAPGRQPEPADGVTVRLRDIGGAGPVAARVGLFTGLASASTPACARTAAGTALPRRRSAAQRSRSRPPA